MLASRVSHFTESVIRETTRLAQRHGAVNLGQGMPDFDPPEVVKEAACKAIRDGFVNEKAYVERTPMKRLGRPEEIAKAALFLASEEDSSFVAGHFLVVDGGWTAFGYVTD